MSGFLKLPEPRLVKDLNKFSKSLISLMDLVRFYKPDFIARYDWYKSCYQIKLVNKITRDFCFFCHKFPLKLKYNLEIVLVETSGYQFDGYRGHGLLDDLTSFVYEDLDWSDVIKYLVGSSVYISRQHNRKWQYVLEPRLSSSSPHRCPKCFMPLEMI